MNSYTYTATTIQFHLILKIKRSNLVDRKYKRSIDFNKHHLVLIHTYLMRINH